MSGTTATVVIGSTLFARQWTSNIRPTSTSSGVVDARTSVEESPVAEMLVSRVALLGVRSPREETQEVILRPLVCAVDPRHILDVMGSTHSAHVSRLESLSRKGFIMSLIRHEWGLALREDSLTRATTGLVQLCKPVVKQPLGTSDEKVYDFSVSIERGRYQMVGRPGALQLDSCKKHVYFFPIQLDEKLAVLHLPALGAVLTVFAQEHQFMLVSRFKAKSVRFVATLEESNLSKKEGRRPKDRSLTTGTTRTPGWKPKETASQLTKQWPSALSTPLLHDAQKPWSGHPRWAAPLTTSLRGLWVSGLLPPGNGGSYQRAATLETAICRRGRLGPWAGIRKRMRPHCHKMVLSYQRGFASGEGPKDPVSEGRRGPKDPGVVAPLTSAGCRGNCRRVVDGRGWASGVVAARVGPFVIFVSLLVKRTVELTACHMCSEGAR